jgi:hypothetical protein
MLTLLILLAAQTGSPTCPARASKELLLLSYDAFDTNSGQSAWRNLLARGCTDTAVATLVAYRDTNQGRLTRVELGEINFHMGQALAMAGRNAEAVAHFEQSAKLGGSAEWTTYVAANLAFVRKDQAALQKSLTEYEKLASPGSSRLAFIRGFLRCIDRPYMEAAHCGM